MQSSTPHKTELYKGQDSSTSPTGLDDGVFSLCSGGVPRNGGFQRAFGKTLRDLGLSTGGVISIYQFGNQVVVQAFVGLIIFDLRDLIPQTEDYIVDNEGNLVTTKSGFPVLT